MKTLSLKLIALFIIVCLLQACNKQTEVALADFTWKIQGTKVTFTNMSYNAQVFNWNFGDSLSSTSNIPQPEFTYNDGGIYWVTLSVDGDKGRDEIKKRVELTEFKGKITIDGDFNDWATTKPIQVDPGAQLTALQEVKLYADKQFIYVYIKIDQNVANGSLATYLDYDVSPTTGYKPAFAQAGFEGLTELGMASKDGDFFDYTGIDGASGWNWDVSIAMGSGLYSCSDIKISGAIAEQEFALNKSMMRKLGKTYVGLYFSLVDSEWSEKGFIPSVGNLPIKLNLKTGAISIN